MVRKSSPSEPDRIAVEAAHWLSQLELGTAVEADFQRWRAQDVRHALEFARVSAAWEKLAQRSAENVLERSIPGISRRSLVRSVAAGTLMTALAGGLIATRAAAWDHAETDVGHSRKVRLPDGSIVALNTNSAVSWKFDDHRRSIWIERGEVAIDLRPGRIGATLESITGRAKLSPGRFNARLRGDALDVMVLRGEATSEPADDRSRGTSAPESADAFHSLLLTPGTPSVRPVSSQAVDAVLAWQNGEILFQDEPLISAVEEYNRYLPRKIVIVDRDLGQIRVGGRFTSSDPALFLEGLEASLNIDVQTSGTNYLLTKKT